MNSTPWQATILTLFPEMFPGTLAHSIAGKALTKNIWNIDTVNIRDFATDKHKTVDDKPYGGGTGLVMMPDIVHAALLEAKARHNKPKPKFVYVTPRGKVFDQKMARQISEHEDGVIILCGRYEGVDHRVIEYWQKTEDLIEVSIGDYVLSGGEIAASVILDACVRLLPNVLIKEEATQSESFELDLLEFSQYTRPCIWQNMVVPEILLSGDHSKIAAWRKKSAENITKERRPDIWKTYENMGTNAEKG